MSEECMKAFSILSRKKPFDIKNYSSLKVKGEFECFNSASEDFTPNISIAQYIKRGKTVIANENRFWDKWIGKTSDGKVLRGKRIMKD